MSEYDILNFLDDETIKDIEAIVDEFMEDDEWIVTDSENVGRVLWELTGGEDETE